MSDVQQKPLSIPGNHIQAVYWLEPIDQGEDIDVVVNVEVGEALGKIFLQRKDPMRFDGDAGYWIPGDESGSDEDDQHAMKLMGIESYENLEKILVDSGVFEEAECRWPLTDN